MEIERIQCLVKLNQNEHGPALTEVVRSGPDALLATEIPLIRMMNDLGDGLRPEECSVSRAFVVGKVETTKEAEYERLTERYGPALVKTVYPGGRMMPKTLDDCELPAGCAKPELGAKKSAPKPKASSASLETTALRAALIAKGVDIPAGTKTEAQLRALAEANDVELPTEAA